MHSFLTVFAVYLPYFRVTETQDAEDLRVAAFHLLEDLTEEAAKRGAVLIIGDFNTSIKYKFPDEHFFGNFLFADPSRPSLLQETDPHPMICRTF